LTDANNITLTAASTAGIASNNFIIQTTTSPVERQAAQIFVSGTDVNSWYPAPATPSPSSTAPCPKDKPTSVSCANFWTTEFTGKLDNHPGHAHGARAGDADIKDVRLYLDDGSKTFEPSVDAEISNTVVRSSFSQGSANLKITNPDTNGLITLPPGCSSSLSAFRIPPPSLPAPTAKARKLQAATFN